MKIDHVGIMTIKALKNYTLTRKCTDFPYIDPISGDTEFDISKVVRRRQPNTKKDFLDDL